MLRYTISGRSHTANVLWLGLFNLITQLALRKLSLFDCMKVLNAIAWRRDACMSA